MLAAWPATVANEGPWFKERKLFFIAQKHGQDEPISFLEDDMENKLAAKMVTTCYLPNVERLSIALATNLS